MPTKGFPFMLICVMLFSVLTGCKTGSQSASASIDFAGTLCLSIPDEFKFNGNLNDNAPLQYKNPTKDIYIVGLSDKKRDIRKFFPRFSLDDYLSFVSRKITNGLQSFHTASVNGFTIGSVDGKTAEIHGTRNYDSMSMEMIFNITVLESDKHFFQIVTWGSENESTSVCSTTSDLVYSATEITAGGSEASGAESFQK